MEPLPLTVGDIVAATGGRLVAGEPGQAIGPISIDSRTVAQGHLFVAVRGDRFDGHAFVAEALGKGALGAVVHEPVNAAGAAVLVQVDDTTRALQAIARDVRRRSCAKVVAITGSAGKTTTKEIVAEFLATKHTVFRNKGNFNNHIGLPLSLLELRSRPEVAVVELGMNHPGEIRTLVGIAEPDVRVWTNVGDAHLGFFASSDDIADAKGEILELARATDLLVANGDDARIRARIGAFGGRVVTFGTDERSDVRAAAVRLNGLDGTSADIRTPAGDVHLSTPLLGLGNLFNVLAAVAVALHFEVPLDVMAKRAATLRPAHHRGELLRLPGGVTLVDDSYNSSPAALKRALETVQAASGSARKAAVLGEMLELGPHTQALHEECGAAAASAGLSFLITVGGHAARALADAAILGGMARDAVVHVATSEQAADVALQKIRPGDLVLVKGSRGIGTDLVVARLKAEFA